MALTVEVHPPETQLATQADPRGEYGRSVSSYRPGLDVARFLAALWVMLSHATGMEGGGHAVAVFFVLSGYLIGGQLVSEKSSRGTVSLNEFYFKRVTRIWVPYYLVLAFFIVLFMARGQNSVPGFYERMVGALTYTYNLFNDLRGSVHPTWVSYNQIWSLAIEEQFYLVVPLLVFWTPARLVAPLAFVLACLLLVTQPLYAGLALGVSMSAFRPGRAPLSERCYFSPMWLAPLAVSFVALFALAVATSFDGASWATYLISAAVVLIGAQVSLPHRLHGGLRTLGLMTYSYYLIHGLPGYFLGAAYRRGLSVPSTPIWANVVFGVLALPLSYFFVRWIELPMLRVRSEMLKKKSPLVSLAPWLAWGVSLVGLAALVYTATHS